MMKFKNILLTSLSSISLLVLSAQSVKNLNIKFPAQKENLELTGAIPGLQDGETVILRRLEYDKQPELIDSGKVSNGKFHFQYYIDSPPQYFTISFSKHAPFIALPLSNEKSLITSKISLDSMDQTNFVDYITVDGSKTFDDWIYIGLGIGRPWYYSNQWINGTINKLKDSTLTKDKLEYILGLLRAKDLLAHSASVSMDYEPARDIIPLFYRDRTSEIQHSSVWPYIFTRLSDGAKKSLYGKWMSDRIALCVGQESPNFNFISNDGSKTSSSEVFKQNRLTILHFWANGSPDRVRIHNELAKAYKKYKTRGLEVVSVSLDANPDKWKRVILEDKIPGYQVCDFKEEEGPIAQLYKVDTKSTINILIDQNGKIVAWDVDGPALFGYLYQFFGE